MNKKIETIYVRKDFDRNRSFLTYLYLSLLLLSFFLFESGDYVRVLAKLSIEFVKLRSILFK